MNSHLADAPSLLDPAPILTALATRRPVFHSEADFQFSFAWEAKLQYPGLEVRLETHPEPAVRLDLELIDPVSRRGVAIELKYMTRRWVGQEAGESYGLKNHGASDLRAYDVVKDLVRIERFIGARPGWSGLVIALTNEGAYWRKPTHGRVTNADAFRIYEGNVLAGDRGWGPNTGGTSKGREAILSLSGTYPLTWNNYSRVDSTPAGTFRSLTIPVRGTQGADVLTKGSR